MRNTLKHFLTACASLTCCLAVQDGDAPPRPQPPFRVLFSNDLTNIVTCVSPYSAHGEPFTRKGLFGTVDETAGIGIDAHMLQPGYGWVPFWKSKLYPAAEHARWFTERYGLQPSSYTKYMIDGGDIVGEFVQRCREKGLAPFVSLRMNDMHEKMWVDFTKEEMSVFRKSDDQATAKDDTEKRHDFIKRRVRDFFDLTVSEYYDAHPEYRLNNIKVPPRGDQAPFLWADENRNPLRKNNIWNWAIPEVRQHKLDFITEICENYDIDGLEMDFTRHRWLFRDDVPEAERRKIMTGYVRQVRAVLDRTTPPGRHRWLSLRLPFRISQQKQMGLDIKSCHDAGVDIFNLSCHYITQQQHDLAKIHEEVPGAPLYLELTHTPQRFEPVDKSRLHGRDSTDLFLLTKPEQFYTAAHLAYRRGAQGVTAFNFVYYREHDERMGGTVAEPPFEVFQILRDPGLVAQQPQHYFLSTSDYKGRDFKRPVKKGFDETFTLDMAPPAGGWTTDGRLRLQVEPAWGGASSEVSVNGTRLEPTGDISEPYPTKFDEGLGDAKSLRAWTLPKALLKDGINEIRIVIPEGIEGELVFLDIGIR